MITFFPSKRSIGTCVSAATIIQSASAISWSVSTFFAPPLPLVSIFTKQSAAFAAFSIPSAAIYVCAIPVGHAVTARILKSLSAFPVSASCSSMSALSSSALSIIERNSSADIAFLRASVNCSSISIIDNLLSTSR